MPTYTVHQPPTPEGRAADPQRFVFVRDGFHFWAFLLTPLWLLYRRLWLALIGYLVLTAALAAAFYFLRAPDGARFVIGLLLGVLVGLEAGTLRRWGYARRKWKTIGVVSGEDEETAERRFFSAWVTQQPPPPAAVPVVPSVLLRDPAAAGEIIGLFPEPERRA